MTSDQGGALRLFEKAGFRSEAVLRGHVRDEGGKPRDLAILSMEIAGDQASR
jgi:RimJ/RimL family protein N-acetyltransferase